MDENTGHVAMEMAMIMMTVIIRDGVRIEYSRSSKHMIPNQPTKQMNYDDNLFMFMFMFLISTKINPKLTSSMEG